MHPWRINLVTEDPLLQERIKAHRGGGEDYRILISSEVLPKGGADAAVVSADLLPLFADRLPYFPTIAYGKASHLRQAFLAGCVDYLKEPWSVEELFLRLERLLSAWKAPIEGCSLSFSGNRLCSGDSAVSLTHPESLLLKTLLKNRGRIVSREVFFYALWGKLPSTQSRTVDVHISSLRKKIRTLTSVDPISTFRGVGYCIE